jgi:hypothetical protein
VSSVAQVNLLSPYLRETPADLAASHGRKAFAFHTLYIITQVATLAIIASILIFSLGLGITTGVLPYIFVGLAISTVPLSYAANKLLGKSVTHGRIAEEEGAIALKLKELESPKKPHIGMWQARFVYWIGKASESDETAPIASDAVFIPDQGKDALLGFIDSEKWEIRKKKAIAVLNTALMLQLMKKPYEQRKTIMYDPTKEVISSDLGNIHSIPFILQESYIRRNLTPIFFSSKDGKRSFTIKQLEALAPSQVRAMLFDPLPAASPANPVANISLSSENPE